MVQSGALWERLPRLRYVVVSTASGKVGSIVRKITNVKVCGGQHSQWCSREHCGTDCQDQGIHSIDQTIIRILI